jgi:hypothetical protein
MRPDSSPPRGRGPQPVSDPVRARDAGLRLARSAQRWIAALAVGAASALAAVTAHAYHTHAVSPTVTSVARPDRAVDNGGDSSGSTARATSIQPLAAAPAPAASTNVAPVVSGGS